LEGGGPLDERELRELLLGGLAVPEARPAFRAQLRQRFLAAAGTEAPERASRARVTGRTTPPVKPDVEDLLAASSAPPPARPAFREELRERFLAAVSAPAGRRSAPARRRAAAAAPSARGARRPRTLRLVAALGLVAAALLVLLWRPWPWSGAERPGGPSTAALARKAPLWRVADIAGEGPIRIDGREIDPEEADLEAELVGAVTLETLQRQLSLSAGPKSPAVDVCVRPGTELTLAAWAPGEDGAQRLRLGGGEIYLRTNGPRHDAPSLVATPETEVRVTGTTLGIMAAPEFTCVCVLEGLVAVDPKDPRYDPLAVPSHTTQVVFPVGGEAPVHHPFAAPPDQHVQDLLDFGG